MKFFIPFLHRADLPDPLCADSGGYRLFFQRLGQPEPFSGFTFYWYRELFRDGEALKAERNKLSKANGPLFGKLKKCTDETERSAIQMEIDANNAAVKADAERMAQLEAKKEQAEAALNKIMLVIPQMIDPSVPIGPDDSCNVEVQRFGEPKTPDFDIPYHTDIMERFDGIDMDAAARVSGSRLLLPAGRYRPSPRGRAGLRPGTS